MNVSKLNKSDQKIVPTKSKKVFVDTAHLPELREAMKKRGWVFKTERELNGGYFDFRTSCRFPPNIF